MIYCLFSDQYDKKAYPKLSRSLSLKRDALQASSRADGPTSPKPVYQVLISNEGKTLVQARYAVSKQPAQLP